MSGTGMCRGLTRRSSPVGRAGLVSLKWLPLTMPSSCISSAPWAAQMAPGVLVQGAARASGTLALSGTCSISS